MFSMYMPIFGVKKYYSEIYKNNTLNLLKNSPFCVAQNIRFFGMKLLTYVHNVYIYLCTKFLLFLKLSAACLDKLDIPK